MFLIGSMKALPLVLHGQDYLKVDVAVASKLIGGLKVIEEGTRKTANEIRTIKGMNLVGIPSLFTPCGKNQQSAFCYSCGGPVLATAGIQVKTTSVEKPILTFCMPCAEGKNPLYGSGAEEDAVREERKAIQGLHLTGTELFRIDEDGYIYRKKGRFWDSTSIDPGLNEMTLIDAAKATKFGIEMGRCVSCGEPIGHGVSVRSQAVGYGPWCARQYGWYYPKNEAEAQQIIMERAEEDAAAS